MQQLNSVKKPQIIQIKSSLEQDRCDFMLVGKF